MREAQNMSRYIKIGLLIAIVALAILFYFLDPLVHPIFPKCIFHSMTGLHCPGCGSQRAIHSLVHLNFAGVVSNNVLFIPALLMVVYGISIPVINRKFEKNYPNLMKHPKTPLVILILIILFWIIRNIPFYPFTILAPG